MVFDVGATSENQTLLLKPVGYDEGVIPLQTVGVNGQLLQTEYTKVPPAHYE